MRKKHFKRNRKICSIILTFGMLASVISIPGGINGKESRASTKKEEYIIQTDDKAVYGELQSDLKDVDKDNSIILTINGTKYEIKSQNQLYEDNPFFYSYRFSLAGIFSDLYMRDMLHDTGDTTSKTTYYTNSAVRLI